MRFWIIRGWWRRSFRTRGTFSERLADLPFVVEVVSRLRKPAETKAVLRDFSAGVAHPVTHFHRREFLVEIDRELFVLDRDVRRRLLVCRRRVTGHWNPRLPGAAVSE